MFTVNHAIYSSLPAACNAALYTAQTDKRTTFVQVNGRAVMAAVWDRRDRTAQIIYRDEQVNSEQQPVWASAPTRAVDRPTMSIRRPAPAQLVAH